MSVRDILGIVAAFFVLVAAASGHTKTSHRKSVHFSTRVGVHQNFTTSSPNLKGNRRVKGPRARPAHFAWCARSFLSAAASSVSRMAKNFSGAYAASQSQPGAHPPLAWADDVLRSDISRTG
jgi:hypothetical protein